MVDFFNDTNLLAPARAVVESRSDGAFILRSPEPLQPYARCIGEWLERWAREAPGRTFLAERDGDGWFRLSYAEARQRVGSLAQSLLDLGEAGEMDLKPADLQNGFFIGNAARGLVAATRVPSRG